MGLQCRTGHAELTALLLAKKAKYKTLPGREGMTEITWTMRENTEQREMQTIYTQEGDFLQIFSIISKMRSNSVNAKIF